MRNLLEYPVTTEEIIEVLTRLRDKAANTEAVGGIEATCIDKAIERIQGQRWWKVTRTDDNGQYFVIRDGLSRGDAIALRNTLAARGHKQTYDVELYDRISGVRDAR